MKTIELQGITHELTFWARFVQSQRFLQSWVPNTPNPELHPLVSEFFETRKKSRVLDVGSGVVSLLRGTVEDVVMCDPLGGLYEIIFDYAKYKIEPALAIPAEEIDFHEAFDVVHISNALDHTQDPVLALARLKAAVRRGGSVIVQGFEREGTFEKQQGFHQWDLWTEGEQLKMCKPDENVSRILGVGQGSRHHLANTGRDWYIWIWQKA